jgi:hypothetical protein
VCRWKFTGSEFNKSHPKCDDMRNSRAMSQQKKYHITNSILHLNAGSLCLRLKNYLENNLPEPYAQAGLGSTLLNHL